MTIDDSRFPHGGDWATYEENCGGEVRDFSANVSPLGLPESVKEAVVSSLDYAHRYPDPECRKLRRAIAEKYELKSESVLCGNGAADIIYRLAYAVRPRRALLFAPDFCEYESVLAEVGCEMLYWGWMEEIVDNSGKYDLSREAGCVSQPLKWVEDVDGELETDNYPMTLSENLDMIIFSNPNNPSGYIFKTEFLHDLLRQCEEKHILLVVDECFMEFTECGDEQSLLALAGKYSCLCVLRAFTKFYGMAGLRLGWCVTSDIELIDRIKKAGPPWSVSIPAQAAGVAALCDDEYARKLRRLVTEERERMFNELQELGMKCVCGRANYILFYTDVLDLRKLLLDREIAIRDCSNYVGLGPGWFRVAVRLREENEVLIERLREINH